MSRRASPSQPGEGSVRPPKRVSAQPRVGRGELVSAVSAVGLLICVFAFAWYGRIGTPAAISGVGHLGSEDGWTALAAGRWLMLLCILVALGSLALHVSQSGHGIKTDTGPLTLLVSLPTAVLIAVRVLVAPPAPDRIVDAKLGGYLGVLLCAGIALGGWRTLDEERERRGGGPEVAAARPAAVPTSTRPRSKPVAPEA